jgi:dolichol-phosphate mannosyltransferase
MQTWSVGILCYNEAGTVSKVVTDVQGVLRQMTDAFEIVIVDDYSTDGSREIALKIQNDTPEVRVILHDVNKGIGQALRSFYSGAKYQNLGIVPGDGQFDPREFLPFKELPDDSFVSFYRLENTSYGVFRNLLSFFNKMLNQVFIGMKLRDVNWTKIYKKRDLDRLDLQLTSSLLETEICAKLIALGRRVIESESRYLPRTCGTSKGASFPIVIKALREILTLLLIMRQFKKQLRNNPGSVEIPGR